MNPSQLVGITIAAMLVGCGDRGPSVTSDTSVSELGTIEHYWVSDDLAWPTIVVANDTIVAIADRDCIHVVQRSTREGRCIGERGDGPGEFQRIGGIDLWGDSIAAWDWVQHRLTVFGPDLTVARTLRVNVPVEFVGGVPLRLSRNDAGAFLVAFSRGMTYVDGPPDTTVIYRVDEAHSPRAVGAVRGMSSTRGPQGAIMPKELYGFRPIVAGSPGGGVAWSDGTTYTVHVSRPDETEDTIVHDVHPAAAPTFSLADLTSAGVPERDAEFAIERRRLQTHLDSTRVLEELLFSEDGQLWVKRASTLERFDPMILGPHPELRVEVKSRWDIYEGGRLVGACRIPTGFRPRWIGANEVLGVVSDDLDVPVLASASRGACRF